MKLKLQFIIAFFIGLVVNIPAVQAQAKLTFSGGNNSPITITLLESVTYTINNGNCALGGAQPSTGPIFVFDEAGDAFKNSFPSIRNTSTIRYSINGGAAQSITTANSGRTALNDRTFNDIYVYGNQQSLPMNTTVVLSAGTIITTGNFTGTLPANGSYSTFITNNFGMRCSTISMATTAATVSVSGHVTSPSGRGITGVLMSLTDSEGNVRTAVSAAGGYYEFSDIEVGKTYIISATAKRFAFNQPVQILNVNEETTEVNFIADSGKRIRAF